MSIPNMGGADVRALSRIPSIDLAQLATLLAKALDSDNPAVSDLFDVKQHALNVNMSAALRLLFKTPGFKDNLAPGETTGLLRDFEIPPRGTSAKVGGRLVPGSEAKATQAIERLSETVSSLLEETLDGVSLSELVLPSVAHGIDTLSAHLQVRLPEPPLSASIVPVGFVSPSRPTGEREKDVARLLAAVETLEGRDWLEKLLLGIRKKLVDEDWDEDDIEPILKAVRDQRDQPGSQIQRFLDFLDDEALARVRLQVSFRLMQSVAAQSPSAGLKAYVERVLECFRIFGSSAGAALPLDGSTHFGQRNITDLSEHLRKALFYGCLPVWPEGSAQLFEARTSPETGTATQREVSYRFRVNGLNPETGKSAFASRVDRLSERLLKEERKDGYNAKAIAELVFLRLVIPDSFDNPSSEDLKATAETIAASLKANPQKTVEALVKRLRSRESTMEKIAKSLIKVLQTKSTKLVDDANRVADKFYIAVHRKLVDWTVVGSMTSRNTDILVKNDHGNDNIAWFEHLTVTENPSEVRGLASFLVETHLVERAIAPVASRKEVRISRDLSCPVLPVHIVPCQRSATSAASWESANTLASEFDVGCGVRILYDERSLRLDKHAKNDAKPVEEQLRAASCAAFALLSYVILWSVVRRMQQSNEFPGLAVQLIRLQTKGKDTKPEEGTSAVYAACHAIERALSRELLVKMQGFNTEGATNTSEYRKRNTLLALQGAFPIQMDIGGTLDKVAVLSYVTRPCDTHPLHSDADGYVFMSRTFVADRTAEGMRVSVDRMQSKLVESRKSFREPQLILEEIARLQAMGYRHIMLLSHHFGNRHIGRAAERHAPHSTREFLESAAEKFPNVLLYSLRRDVFPATRLHTRIASESAFEAFSFADHQKMYQQAERELLRGLQPVYTFATLAVVTESGRPQSGFCTYYFDIEERLSNFELSEAVRQNILGTTLEGKGVKESLLGVLRALHYLESERAPTKSQVLPVLDPFGWAAPSSSGGAGELEVMSRRGKGNVLLSFPAILAHVTKVLHKNKERA